MLLQRRLLTCPGQGSPGQTFLAGCGHRLTGELDPARGYADRPGLAYPRTQRRGRGSTLPPAILRAQAAGPAEASLIEFARGLWIARASAQGMGICASAAAKRELASKPSERVPVHKTTSLNRGPAPPPASTVRQSSLGEADRQLSSKERAQAPDVKLPVRVFKGDKARPGCFLKRPAGCCWPADRSQPQKQLAMRGCAPA